MAKTKGDLVLKALRKAGLYSNATLTDADPQAIEDAINDLEDMMAAWQAKGIELGYQFADTENGIMPLPDDDSGSANVVALYDFISPCSGLIRSIFIEWRFAALEHRGGDFLTGECFRCLSA